MAVRPISRIDNMGYNPDKHHRRSLRLPNHDYASTGLYFITACTYQRQCLFGEIRDSEMHLNELGHIVRSHWLRLPQYHRHLQLDAFVVMPNHIHGILILTNADPAPTLEGGGRSRAGIGEIIRGFKTFSARRINQIRKVKGIPVWQRNYYEHIIRNKTAWQRICQYIQNNPASWQTDQLHADNPPQG